VLGHWRRPAESPLRALVDASIRDGVGLRQREWLLAAPIQPHEVHALADEVVEWTRVNAGETRRSHGIDQCALALACAHPGGAPIASGTFGVFRPIDLYTDGGIPDRVRVFLDELPLAVRNESGQPVRFAAALFS